MRWLTERRRKRKARADRAVERLTQYMERAYPDPFARLTFIHSGAALSLYKALLQSEKVPISLASRLRWYTLRLALPT